MHNHVHPEPIQHRHHSTTPSSSSSTSSSPVLERLYQRLVHVNQEFSLHMSEQDMIRTVQQGADFANRGLGNLASTDPQVFLQHMWSLLPEQFEPLRRQFLYTLLDLHTAVQEMRHFFATLLPKFYRPQQDCHVNALFSSFRGIPDAREMKHFHQQVQYNVAIGYEYLLAQCVSLRLVAALARLTGGAGAPMSFFFGDQPHNQPRPDDEPQMVRLGEVLFIMEFGEQHLVDLHDDCDYDYDDADEDEEDDARQVQTQVECEVEQDEDDLHHHNYHQLKQDTPGLAKGSGSMADERHSSLQHHRHNHVHESGIRTTVLHILQEDCWGTHVYNFLDPRNAYLAAYLYKKLNHAQMERIACQPLNDDESHGDNECCELDMVLLQQHIPLHVLEPIVEDLGHIAITRRKRLEAIIQDLRQLPERAQPQSFC